MISLGPRVFNAPVGSIWAFASTNRHWNGRVKYARSQEGNHVSEHSTKNAGRDALAAVRAGNGPAFPKRFYKAVTVGEVEGGFAVLLDGRSMMTPGRRRITLPTRALAGLCAAEWEAQGEFINPQTMPVTRLVNSAVEGVAGEMLAVADEISRYAGSDLVCYRAAAPTELAAEQAQAWSPLLDWANAELGARFILSEGVMFVAQPKPALAVVKDCIARVTGSGSAAPFRLAALSVITSLTGSALLALQHASGAASAAQAWAAAHVDEEFQARLWGVDEDAQARRTARWREMEAAAQVLETCPVIAS